MHAKIAASMTVTFAEIVKAPEQPFAEQFIYNAVRKTMDQGQLELVKSGNRQPVPVTTRFYSPWKKHFNFNDTTEAQRMEYLAAKVLWLSGVLGGGQPVWLLDPDGCAVSEHDGGRIEEERDRSCGRGRSETGCRHRVRHPDRGLDGAPRKVCG